MYLWYALCVYNYNNACTYTHVKRLRDPIQVKYKAVGQIDRLTAYEATAAHATDCIKMADCIKAVGYINVAGDTRLTVHPFLSSASFVFYLLFIYN